MNTGILVKLEEYLVELQGIHSPHNLEYSVDVEVPGVSYYGGPGTTSSKCTMFSSSEFLPSSTKTPNISNTSILPRRSPMHTPKSLMMPSTHNSDTRITTNSSSDNKINNTPLTNNSGISSNNHMTNNVGILSLNHVSEKSSIEDNYPNFNDKYNSYLLPVS